MATLGFARLLYFKLPMDYVKMAPTGVKLRQHSPVVVVGVHIHACPSLLIGNATKLLTVRGLQGRTIFETELVSSQVVLLLVDAVTVYFCNTGLVHFV